MPRSKLHQDRQQKREHTKKADSRLMAEEGEKRSGSDSNAHRGRKHEKLHENHADQNQPMFEEAVVTDQELRPHNEAGEDHGMEGRPRPQGTISAHDLKNMYTTLADLRDDELKSIEILPEGTRLEQGASYIDLRHLEQGEFKARASMVAGPENAYVAKKEVDYVLWNRLNQVDTPERLDESSPESA